MNAITNCPKCSFASNTRFSECPKCGIIVSKFLSQKSEDKDLENKDAADKKSALQNLAAANALMVRQQKEWGEILTGFETKNKYQLPDLEHHHKIRELITKKCQDANISPEELKAGSRRTEISCVRAQIAIGLVKTHGVALAETARQLGVSTSAISKIIKRAG